MKFLEFFKTRNTINEKAVIGSLSFLIMTIFAIADISMGLMGKELTITETIYNSFVIVTLGSFGIDSIHKIFLRRKEDDHETE
jgi:hypothetical protein